VVQLGSPPGAVARGLRWQPLQPAEGAEKTRPESVRSGSARAAFGPFLAAERSGDTQPANVMLVADPDMAGGERVKVLDFGIAKMADNPSPGQVETRAGSVLGSPAYMSPEQCRNVGKVNDRSDVYALGVILFEMLAGRQPFRAESEAELMAMHMYSSPPRLRQLASGVSSELEALIMSMLSKSAAQRPAMQDVLNALNRIGGFGTTASRPMIPITATAETAAPSSTLSRAVGAGSVAQRFNLRARLGIGGALLAIVIGGLFISQGLRRKGVAGNGAELAEVPPTPVHWSLTSEPPGAQVFSAEGNRLVGQTPYAIEMPRHSGVERLVLRLSGYRDSTVTFDRGQSADRVVTLAPSDPADPLPGQTPRAASGQGGRAKGPAKGSGKGSRIKNADIQLIK